MCNSRKLAALKGAMIVAGVPRDIAETLETIDKQLKLHGFSIKLERIKIQEKATCPYCRKTFRKSRHDQITCGGWKCKTSHRAKLWRRWKTENETAH